MFITSLARAAASAKVQSADSLDFVILAVRGRQLRAV